MSFSKLSVLLALASQVAAHGTASGIVADGVYYEGYNPSFQYMQTQPVLAAWSIPEDLGNGFVAPSAYADPDIICHLNATNAQGSATVKAGGTVEVQWTPWPSSHKGPVIDYLASCKGDCKTVDKTTLEFFKIDGVGLLDDAVPPGNWASDTLIAKNNSWTVTIPKDIAPGSYVLRHEIIALHSAGSADGAQNYPQCFNLEVIGSGSATPSGTLGTGLYKETDPGILVNIYSTLASYIVPGPALYSGAVSVSQSAQPTATAVAPVSSTLETSAPSIEPLTTTSAAGISTSSASATPSISECQAMTTITLPTIPTTSPPPLPTTFASTVTIATTTSAIETSTLSIPVSTTPTPSSSSPSSSNKSKIEIPSNTTLNDLLSWLSAFYTKYTGSGETYTSSSLARRYHARDVVSRSQMVDA